MPEGTSIPVKRFTPRYSFMAVALIGLVIFSIAITAIGEYQESTERDDFIDRNLQVRVEAMTVIFEEQFQSTGIDNTLRHRLAEAYARGPAIIWTQIVPSRNDLTHGAHPPLQLPANPAITEELIAHIVAATEGEPGAHMPLRAFGSQVLVARRLVDGHVFFVLFDRDQIASQFSMPHKPLWMFVIALVSVAALILYFSSRYFLQKPIERLSQALVEAENTFELRLDKPLPKNEIGWLGRRIEDWFARLRSTQEELERMALVSQGTRNAIMILDANRKTVWVNEAFTEITGYAPDEVIGKEPREYMRSGETDPAIAKMVDESFTNGKGFMVEAKVQKRDGSSIWISAEAQPVFNDGGDITDWICVDADITERKLAEEELALRVLDLETAREEQSHLTKELVAAKKAAERSNASKSEFLANMSHEIRTPMNGVLGMADVLLTTDLTVDQKEFVQTIKESGAGLLTIINDILDLSKLEAGKIALEKSATDINRTMASVTELMTPRARAKGVDMSFEVSADVPHEIVEDGGRLRQILLNLVGNAIKFTNEGSIKLSASISNANGKARYLRIEVEDTGVGISEEHQKKLFQRFEQGDMTGARAAGGTGLGLSICRELTWLMGGEIGLASEKGKGSTFWIEIPFLAVRQQPETHTRAEPEQAMAAPAPKKQTSGSRLRLLVAEDHEVNQSLMKAFIGKLGHDLTIAPDGVETVKAVREGSFDMILMDIQMPRMDGVMATKVIRSLESGPSDIPIIAVTANAMAGQRDHYMESGMNGYVSKPVQLEELRSEIDRVWAEYRESREALRNAG